jgi:hypothetical protein
MPTSAPSTALVPHSRQTGILPTTEPLADEQMTETKNTTKSLAVQGPNTTGRLPLVIPATGKMPLFIPATEKRSSITHKPPKSSRRRRVVVAAWGSCAAFLIVALVLVSPLGIGSQQIISKLFDNNIFDSQSNSVSIGPQELTATPTPALLTNEGYCGGHDIWGTCATAVTQSGLMGTGKLVPPIKGSNITQYFANPEYQTWCACIRPHSGVDLAAPYGTPITAADSGQVIWTNWDWSGLGWAVKINHGHYTATVYGHMASYIVKVGQNVTKGQIIGYEGSTGASSGPHVHFMVLVNNIWVDPMNYVALP